MKKASAQWLESAEMDLGSIDQILQVLGRSVKCQELTPQELWQDIQRRLIRTEANIHACYAGPSNYC